MREQLAAAFTKSSGAGVEFTFGASGNLAQQIRHGAPYDVYLSANEAFVKELEAAGKLRKDTVRVYAYGRVGLWSKDGRVRSIQELTQPGIKRVAIANPAHAPYGIAARDALKSQGIWDKVEPKIVYAENVAEAFQYARSGNADAAILSWSLIWDKQGILLPAAWHARIAQWGGAVAASTHPALARRFMDFLSGDGRTVLRRFGFD